MAAACRASRSSMTATAACNLGPGQHRGLAAVVAAGGAHATHPLGEDEHLVEVVDVHNLDSHT
jgi:hypothetical protein